MSKDLLAILSTRDNYNRFAMYVKEHTLSKEQWQILEDMKEYYLTNNEVKWDEFSEWFRLVRHPMYKADKIALYNKLFTQMETHVLTQVAEDIVDKYIGQDFCTRIADIVLKGADGLDIDLDDVQVLLNEHDTEIGKATALETYINTESLEDIIDRQETEGLDWFLEFLNQSIGKLPVGRLVCVAARPNAGKTTFLGNSVCHFLPQLPPDKTILWFNNEEEEGSVKKRIVQCGINWLSSDINANPKAAVLEFEDKVGDLSRIKVINAVSLDTHSCEEIMKHHNPGVIVIDQLRKVRGQEKRTASEVERMEMIFQWAREMAKKYAPVITVHQLSTIAEGVDYPTMDMLYFSGTAIQGEVDSLVMIGRKYEDPDPDQRYISIAKNKEAFGPSVDVNMAEGKEEIKIIPSIGKFEE